MPRLSRNKLLKRDLKRNRSNKRGKPSNTDFSQSLPISFVKELIAGGKYVSPSLISGRLSERLRIKNQTNYWNTRKINKETKKKE